MTGAAFTHQASSIGRCHPPNTRSDTRQPISATRLLGTAAIRETVGFPLPPVHRAAYERVVTAPREQLGETMYAAAWAAGRALTLEQAVAEALVFTTPTASANV